MGIQWETIGKCGMEIRIFIEDALRSDTAAFPPILELGISWFVSVGMACQLMLAVPLVDLGGSCLILADLV